MNVIIYVPLRIYIDFFSVENINLMFEMLLFFTATKVQINFAQ